jgi:hypothetical protein
MGRRYGVIGPILTGSGTLDRVILAALSHRQSKLTNGGNRDEHLRQH